MAIAFLFLFFLIQELYINGKYWVLQKSWLFLFHGRIVELSNFCWKLVLSRAITHFVVAKPDTNSCLCASVAMVIVMLHVFQHTSLSRSKQWRVKPYDILATLFSTFSLKRKILVRVVAFGRWNIFFKEKTSALSNEILHSLLKLEMFFETYQNKDTFYVKFQFAWSKNISNFHPKGGQ